MAETHCPQCQTFVPEHVVSCVGCGLPVGFPNVRAAGSDEQVMALEGLYRAAKAKSAARGALAAVELLERRLKQSVAVICKSWRVITTLMESENRLLATFHQQVASPDRLPERNEYDRKRPGIDATFFPYYYEHIHFAALSIDGRGALGYGSGCMVLKEESIAHRSTVFEENTAVFVRNHHHQAGEPPPPGHAAVWAKRAMLGIAKLAGRVQRGMPVADLPGLVLEQTTSTDGDLIEVHIYGPIHRNAVARISGKRPTEKADQALLRQLRRDLPADVEVKFFK